MFERVKDFYKSREMAPRRLTAAYAFIWSWFLFYTSNCANSCFPIASSDWFFGMRACIMAGIALATLATYLSAKNIHPAASSSGLVVGEVLILAANAWGIPLIAYVGTALIGLGLGSLIVYLNAARLKETYTAEPRVISQSIFFAIAIYLALAPLPTVVMIAYLLLSPLLVFLMAPTPPNYLLFSLTQRTNPKVDNWIHFAIYLLFGLVNGSLHSLDILGYRSWSPDVVFIALCWGCGLVSLFAGWFVHKNFGKLNSSTTTYSFVIILLASVSLLLPFVIVYDPQGLTVTSIPLVALFIRVMFCKTKRVPEATGEERSSTMWRSGYFGTAESSIAEFIGFIVMAAITAFVPVTIQTAIIILEFEFLALTIAIFLNIFLLAPDIPNDETATTAPSAPTLDEACAAIARDCKLTAREAEILRILADGYSLPYIQDKLYIARGTASTHCAHIYQKLGIHKRDELMDVISSYQSSIRQHKH